MMTMANSVEMTYSPVLNLRFCNCKMEK